MTQRSIPWQGVLTGDAGPYSADDWARIWRDAYGVGFGAGGAADSGILWGSGANPDPGLSVQQNSPTGQSIILTPGAAIVAGTYYYNDANLVISTAANGSGNPRIDTVVLRKDWAAQTIRAVVKQGTPAASPVPPGMTQTLGVTWEIPIADLTLANGYTSVTTALIAGRLMYKNVAVMDVIENCQNASGITANPGDVAVFAAVAGQVTTSGLRGASVAGVWMDKVVNGGYGRLLRRGRYPVRLSGAATINTFVVHEANFVAVASAAGASNYNAFAVTLETTAGAGLCMCYVDVVLPRAKAGGQTAYNTPGDITITTATGYADIDGTNLKIPFTTNSGKIRTIFTLPAYLGLSVAGTAWVYFNMLLDGATQATTEVNGLYCVQYDQAAIADRAVPCIIDHIWQNLTPGVHSVTLRWKIVLGTGTGPTAGIRAYTASAGFPARMVWEELDA